MPDIVPVSATTFGAVQQSNLPEKHKSQIREWYDRTITRAQSQAAPIKNVANEVAEVAKADLIAGATGYALAMLEEHVGSLDVGSKKNIPLDGLGVGAGALVAFLFAGQGLVADIGRGVSAGSSAVMMYRKHRPQGNAAALPNSPAAHGDFGQDSDPLLNFARNL